VKETILKYLNKNYRFTLSTYNSYFIRDRIYEQDVKLADVTKSLGDIFSIDDDSLRNTDKASIMSMTISSHF
jgi:bacterioferritin (cytochrome b1)